MSNIECLHSHSLFLRRHPALHRFCEFLDSHGTDSLPPPATVVCERKEDVVAARNQLFEMLRAPGQNPNQGVWAGVSTHTLDSLGQSLAQWAFLALKKCPGLGSFGELTLADLRQPYLDIVSQEKLVEQILLCCGYSGTDSLPLSKQLLTLIDTPLPPETSLAKMILNSSLQPHDSTKGVRSSNRSVRAGLQALTQLLATFQGSKLILDKYTRLQSILQRGFALISEGDLQQLCKALPPRVPGAEGVCLWLEGPSYGVQKGNGAENTHRPGNFSAVFSDGLFDACQTLRRQLQDLYLSGNPTIRPHANVIRATTTVLAPSEESPLSEHSVQSITVFPDLALFLHQTRVALDKPETPAQIPGVPPGTSRNELFLLQGDLSTEHDRSLNFEAAGSHSYSLSDLNPDSARPQVVEENLKEELAEFQLTQSLLEPHFELLSQVVKTFDLALPLRSTSHRFRLLMRTARYHVGKAHPLHGLPQALSFFATRRDPTNICVFGRPHSPRQPSLNVRTLNQVIHRLAREGVAIEVPASDLMYRCFWRSLVSGETPLAFVLPCPDDLKELDDFVPNAEKLAHAPQSPLPPSLRCNPQLWKHGQDPKWLQKRDLIQATRHSRTPKAVPASVSVTAFETYVHCPLQFYLRHVMQLEEDHPDHLSHNPLESGIHTHAALEAFTTSLNFWQLQGGQTSLLPDLLEGWARDLLSTQTFVSNDPEQWLTSLSNSKAGLPLEGIESVLQTLFFGEASSQSLPAKDLPATRLSLSQRLSREARKRFFIRFLFTEAERHRTDARNGRRRKVAFVEQPVSLKLGELRLSGRIDRVDHVEDLSGNTQSHELIDYKTSKLPREESELVLFPNPLFRPNKHRLSVQGGLYILAWKKRLEEQSDVHPSAFPDLSFALYRLGSLDWSKESLLGAHLKTSCSSGREECDRLQLFYESQAARLQAGEFPAQPLHETMCEMCAYKSLCPRGTGEQP